MLPEISVPEAGLRINIMAIKKGFKRDHSYPNESFIQEMIENYFLSQGYDTLDPGHADLKCIHPISGECWLVEAKGKTQAMGLDFRTCLGQILQRMENSDWTYAIALPKLKPYISQCLKVPDRIRRLIKLNWIFVERDGTVLVIKPHHSLDELTDQLTILNVCCELKE